jgi:hypothetical protein
MTNLRHHSATLSTQNVYRCFARSLIIVYDRFPHWKSMTKRKWSYRHDTQCLSGGGRASLDLDTDQIIKKTPGWYSLPRWFNFISS